jgi:hypothetical protein
MPLRSNDLPAIYVPRLNQHPCCIIVASSAEAKHGLPPSRESLGQSATPDTYLFYTERVVPLYDPAGLVEDSLIHEIPRFTKLLFIKFK